MPQQAETRPAEIRTLPLDHAPEAIRDAARARLGVPDAALRDVTVFRRGYDARKRGAIMLVYTLDAEVEDEAAVLRRLGPNAKVGTAKDTSYHLPAPPAKEIRGGVS